MTGDLSQQPWSVNITDDDTRNLSPHEIGQLYAAGQLDLNDTYVWRDGMGDWIPLGECGELQPMLTAGGAAPAAAAPAAAAPVAADPADGGHPFEGTMMMDSPADAGPPAQPDSGYAASASQPAYGAQPGAAPVSESYSSLAASAAAADASRLVGQRNEESALFSLDDIRAAAGSTSAPKGQAPVSDDPFDDLINLGAVGGGGIAAAFAPPPINAPPPPEPKPAPVAPAAPAAQAAAAVIPLQPTSYEAPPPKKGKGLVIGIAAAILLVVVAAGAFFVVSSSGDAPTAKNDTKQSDGDKAGGDKAASDGDKDGAGDKDGDKTAAADDKDGDDKDGDDKDGDDKGDKDGDGTKKDDAKALAGAGDKAATGGAASKPASKPGTKSDDKKNDDKQATASKPDTKSDDKKDDPAPAKSEFNVNAARSALSSAAGAASGCKKDGGPTGKGRVTVTFAPSGRATQALVGPPFAGTSVGSCAAAAFRRASVPPFTGSPMSVSKSFYIR